MQCTHFIIEIVIVADLVDRMTTAVPVRLDQGCPTRGPRAAMRPAWCLGAAHYSFSLQVVFFSKIVTISSKRVERA